MYDIMKGFLNMKEIIEKINRKRLKNANDKIDCSALYELVMRVTEREAYAHKFVFKKLENSDVDAYKMYDMDGSIVIEAANGVVAAVAFNRYLNEYCHSYVGPITKNINLPENPPEIGKIIEEKSVFIFRYFLNYCTFSYSLLFYTWEEYERLTDWMLLSGVNLYLNIVGHEMVVRDMLSELGYSKEEIAEYITGPAYMPWQWMGNMSGFGMKLTDDWYERQTKLSNKINEKMRLFGAEPILPGFFGMVPPDFGEKHPESNPIDQGMWCDSFLQPALLLPNDEMFLKAAEVFYKKTKEHFGEVHYFSGDPFHEGGNTAGFDLKVYGQVIIDTMKEHNADSIWFLQGWTETPKREMLNAIDKEDVVVISLSADKNYNICDNFNGYPWIYSVTCNFGGTRIIAGNLEGMLTEPYDAAGRDDITTVGIGMTMEGIEMDEMLFSAFSYNAVRSRKPDVDEFLDKYVLARCGRINDNLYKAYEILAKEIYILTNNDYSGRESVFCAAPKLDVKTASTSAVVYDVYYDEQRLKKAYELLKLETENNECMRFDLMDMKRQINANDAWHLADKFIAAFKNSDKEGFEKYSDEFLKLADEQNELMAQFSKTRLDDFVKHAKTYGKTREEKVQFAFEALNMLFLWADKESPAVLMDYAHREWNGMLEFYKKRWCAYIELMRIHISDPSALREIDWRGAEYMEVLWQVGK